MIGSSLKSSRRFCPSRSSSLQSSAPGPSGGWAWPYGSAAKQHGRDSWSPRPASIRRPPDPKSDALPGCATRRFRWWSAWRDLNSRSRAPEARGFDRAFLHADESGSRGWDRTSDLGLIKTTLYQLSYARKKGGSPTWDRTRAIRINSPAHYQLCYRGKIESASERGLPLARKANTLRQIQLIPRCCRTRNCASTCNDGDRSAHLGNESMEHEETPK